MQSQPAHLSSITSPSAKPRGRWVLILLFLFFAVPLLLVTLMHELDWHPQGSSYGELIAPARPLHMPPGLQDADGKPLDSALWRDKWSIVYIADECSSTCQQRLYGMRQLHVSLAKDIDRIQRVLISPAKDAALLLQQYPDLVLIHQPESGLTSLSRQFDLNGIPATTGNRLYLVDPLGNIMMSFPPTVSDADVRKDISRLLRYSWAG